MALSNKEVLVAAGELVMAAAKKQAANSFPLTANTTPCINAFAAANPAKSGARPHRSGGPFRKTPLSNFDSITPEQALAHPNWRMGNRITIDSATMMNKGFEIIEARWLFGMRPDQIDVVIHPQSTVHSFVEFIDGSVLAQLGPTDMRMPIQYALTYPERLASNQMALDWKKLKRLDFASASTRRFPV